MKLLCVHAHFDDFEFVAGGTFELFRKKHGPDWAARVLVCTDGQAGHHALSREETGRVRLTEQMESAALGRYEVRVLRLPDHRVPREGCLEVSGPFLAALWHEIRAFEPDYLFCPPLPTDPLAGIHVDHVAVAEGVRKVAYLINVPHAFTPEYPPSHPDPVPCKVPVILCAYDGYSAGANQYDLALDVEAEFPHIAAMTYCHQSQIAEWLPWVGRHRMAPPASREDWDRTLRERFQRQNRDLGRTTDRACEVFSVTAWGHVPTLAELTNDFPTLDWSCSDPARLERRLNGWRGER